MLPGGVRFYPRNPQPFTPVTERINGLQRARSSPMQLRQAPSADGVGILANRDLPSPIHDETWAKLIRARARGIQNVREKQAAGRDHLLQLDGQAWI
jgi:hypothetical protein